MTDQSDFDIGRFAVSAVVLVVAAFLGVHLLPELTAVLYAVIAPECWFCGLLWWCFGPSSPTCFSELLHHEEQRGPWP